MDEKSDWWDEVKSSEEQWSRIRNEWIGDTNSQEQESLLIEYEYESCLSIPV